MLRHDKYLKIHGTDRVGPSFTSLGTRNCQHCPILLQESRYTIQYTDLTFLKRAIDVIKGSISSRAPEWRSPPMATGSSLAIFCLPVMEEQRSCFGGAGEFCGAVLKACRQGGGQMDVAPWWQVDRVCIKQYLAHFPLSSTDPSCVEPFYFAGREGFDSWKPRGQ